MLVLSNCDADTDWTGTALTIDTSDKMEGTGSLKDTVAAPAVINDWYVTTYDPTGTWDWSGKKHILFWFKCDREDADFTNERFFVYEGANYRYWDLTFTANTWIAVKLLLSTGDGESGSPNLALVDKIQLRFKAADTTAFYKKIDHVRVIVGSQGMIGDDYFMRL